MEVQAMQRSVCQELRHRGDSLVEYPDARFWTMVGGSDGVAALIQDLYHRIEKDELLRVAFPHFNSGAATPYFEQWFGGSRAYSDDLTGGLLRQHQHRYISPKAAAAWLRCMREALIARGLEAEPIMRPLARIAKAMIHSPEAEPEELSRTCGAVQDAAQVQFETLLNDAAKGRMEPVRQALNEDHRSQPGAARTGARWPGSRRTTTAGKSLI
jgi:truncated hemoglobin YjbI